MALQAPSSLNTAFELNDNVTCGSAQHQNSRWTCNCMTLEAG
jgi:hypothetical protein